MAHKTTTSTRATPTLSDFRILFCHLAANRPGGMRGAIESGAPFHRKGGESRVEAHSVPPEGEVKRL